MKKTALVAMAAVMVVGPIAANAAGAREARSRADVERAVREAGRGARVAGRGGQANVQVTEAVNALHEARILPRLNPEQKSQLEANLAKSPEMLDTVNKLSRLANGNRDLSAAAIEGMALVKNPSDKTADAIAALIPDVQVEQAYQTLVTKAALKANSWNTETQANFLFLLTEANARIARGSSVKEAMEQANAELSRAKGVRLDVKDINKYCL